MAKNTKLKNESFPKLFDLAGEVAVVTGGQGMLGGEYAETLARAGAVVAVLDIKATGGKKITKLKKSGLPIFEYKVDLTDKNAVDETIQSIEKKLGTPTILVNNAGLGAMPTSSMLIDGPFEDYSSEAWETMIDSHMKSAFFVSQAVVRAMRRAKKKGSIVNVSSTYGVVSPDQSIYEFRRRRGEKYYKPVSYTVAKSAMIGFTKWLSEYAGPFGIRVNTLAPGGVYTSDLNPEFVREYEKRTILGRMAKPTDYNGAVLFLASRASEYVTGTVLIVDGGWTAR